MKIKLKESEKPEEAMYEQLPLEGEVAEKFLAWLVEEHRIALSANDEYLQDLSKLRRAIKYQPAARLKTFPWPGASNFVAPIIRIAGDAVKARVVNTLLGPQPFWVCSAPAGSTYGDYAKPLEKFLDIIAKMDLVIGDTIEQISDQVVYLGKCPIKVVWKYNIKKVRTYNRKTKKETWENRVTLDQAKIVPILLENWLEPWGLEESKDKPWNSHRVFMRAGDLIEQEKQGLINKGVAKKIIDKCLSQLPTDMQELGELQKQAWAEAQVIQLFETHAQYDWDGDGFREELIALWSYDAQCLVSNKFNFFWHTKRPIESLYYLRDGHNRSSADGLAQMLISVQEAISSWINQRSDNLTIANTRHWVAKRNAGFKKGDQIWPGKVTLLDDPKNDLQAVAMGDVSPQSFAQEGMLRDYGERLSGISDPQLGREFDNPRVAATTTLSVLQEGNRRFDMIIRLMRETFSRVGLMIVQLYQQFEPRFNLGDVLSPEEEIYVREILDMSPEEVEKNFIIQVNTSSAGNNKETQRQGLLALFNLIVQFYGQVLDIAVKVMGNPNIPEEIKEMIVEMGVSSYNTLKEIVSTYDITDPDRFLVDVGEALRTVKEGGGLQGVERKIEDGLNQFATENGIPVQGPLIPPPADTMQGQQMMMPPGSEVPVMPDQNVASMATA